MHLCSNLNEYFSFWNRFHKFLLWLGVSAHQVTTTKPQLLFKIISEFALEYRTTRERVIQQLQKKANHRERNKTRGKMITEVSQGEHKTNSKKQTLQKFKWCVLIGIHKFFFSSSKSCTKRKRTRLMQNYAKF